jgi:AcrR family transcriptional regulator
MSRRETLRKEMLEDIKMVARQQMAESGTAGISLSAIARALEVSQPALYRYYPSRDDLITALILDAYNDQANTLEAADAGIAGDAYFSRMLVVLDAYRKWALDHPTDFQLIYGNPIPGYKAPFEVTAPAARRNFTTILNILGQALAAGRLRLPEEHQRTAERLGVGLPDLEYIDAPGVPAALVYIALVGMYRIHGMIMLELFHHTDSLLPDTGAFYRNEVIHLLGEAGLEGDPTG